MLAKIFSSTVLGVDAFLIEVEVDITRGLPAFVTVGLPEVSVRESKERVKAAIKNSGYFFPDDKITVNLAPADVKKEGTGFDLPIALGILAATKLVAQDRVSKYLVLGELSLDGRVKPVKGSLPMAIAAKGAGYEGIIVPEENGNEASVVEGTSVYPVKTLSQVVEFLRGSAEISARHFSFDAVKKHALNDGLDLFEVKGQEYAKRAMEIAAAGGHNMLMSGPPGSGKTMLAKRLSTILPEMTFEETIETTKIYSVVGKLNSGRPLITRRPFRAPHHTISDAGLIGGGKIPRPGEVSLAHNGVLFLDELSEFKKNVLEVLRQPIEDKVVTISRAMIAITYPSSFMLVAAMNPCPCGYLSDPKHECSCSPQQVQRYMARISGPLLDRIDIQVEVPPVPYTDLINDGKAESSETVRSRIKMARAIQTRRFKRSPKLFCNAQMGSRHIKVYCAIESETRLLLEKAVDKLGLSARAFNRVLKVARTIADLSSDSEIKTDHVLEAIQYRSLDRKKRLA